MAQSIKFSHYWLDKDGLIAAAGVLYAPNQTVAAVPDPVALALQHAFIATSTVGTPTAVFPTMIPQLAGAGKVTVVDGDFVGVIPADGWLVQVRNTTDSTVRLATRVNGTWKVSPSYT